MTFRGVDVRCPACGADLVEDGVAEPVLRCLGCGKVHPVVLGIPDLRVFADPYIDMEADRAKGRRLAERFGDLDFEGLVEFYYRSTPAVTAAQARQFTRGVLGAAARSAAALAGWEARAGASPRGSPSGPLLDLGCGTGPLMVAAAARYPAVVGVDIAFRWLVVGKKRLEEAGVDAPLICACAEALPFSDATFDRVAAESTLEHVRDQPQALAEARRVTRPGGWLFVATPNRLSLGPDPHIGLPAGGYLPRRWVAAYARRRGAVPPERRLLSSPALGRLIRAAGYRAPDIYLPDFPAGQRVHLPRLLDWAVAAYQAAKAFPPSRWALRFVGPSLHAVAAYNTAARVERTDRGT